ncbi:hypothetical protein Poly21_24180 [Allorhodopirellula heiligendammensis]|uniref:Uncharacterized protein n=1 Tax=Allorhodopirellula heiligendammensis TaxID=2714739 RepID=A0A5C6BWR0_9BACT|nr:hypothetical protein Poly21_24180 [Allorhodopirellula heiligendammensis]
MIAQLSELTTIRTTCSRLETSRDLDGGLAAELVNERLVSHRQGAYLFGNLISVGISLSIDLSSLLDHLFKLPDSIGDSILWRQPRE